MASTQQALIEAPVGGVEEIEAKRGIQGRGIGALHTKNFLRRAADNVLDNLRFRRSRGDRRS